MTRSDKEVALGIVGMLLLALVPCAVFVAAVAAHDAAAEPAGDAEVATVYDSPASAVTPRTDGPIYDLPKTVGQAIVCDSLNREYLLLTTEQGGVFLMPYLDEDGQQAVMPRP